jgi:hypothetical protein
MLRKRHMVIACTDDLKVNKGFICAENDIWFVILLTHRHYVIIIWRNRN